MEVIIFENVAVQSNPIDSNPIDSNPSDSNRIHCRTNARTHQYHHTCTGYCVSCLPTQRAFSHHDGFFCLTFLFFGNSYQAEGFPVQGKRAIRACHAESKTYTVPVSLSLSLETRPRSALLLEIELPIADIRCVVVLEYRAAPNTHQT